MKSKITGIRACILAASPWKARMLAACSMLASHGALQAAPSTASEPLHLTQAWSQHGPNANLITLSNTGTPSILKIKLKPFITQPFRLGEK